MKEGETAKRIRLGVAAAKAALLLLICARTAGAGEETSLLRRGGGESAGVGPPDHGSDADAQAERLQP